MKPLLAPRLERFDVSSGHWRSVHVVRQTAEIPRAELGRPRRWFVTAAEVRAGLGLHFPRDRCAFASCLGVITLAGLEPKLFARPHVPPASQRGRQVMLTCRPCTNRAGSISDARADDLPGLRDEGSRPGGGDPFGGRRRGPRVAPERGRWAREITAIPDPARKLRLYVRHIRDVAPRIVGLVDTLRATAPADPDVAAFLVRMQEGRREGPYALLAPLAQAGQLRSGLTLATAADITYALASADTFRALVD
jgi:hypothetical protein